MKKGVSIDKAALQEAVKNSGYSAAEISRILGMNDAYIGQAISRGLIGPDKLKSLCIFLKVSTEGLIMKESAGGAAPQKKDTNNEELMEALTEIAKLLKEEVEVRQRSEAKISEILLELQKLGTRSNKYFGNMENWKKFGHF